MKHYLAQRPWIWIVLGFSGVVASLVYMVTIAVVNKPEEVVMKQPAAYADH